MVRDEGWDGMMDIGVGGYMEMREYLFFLFGEVDYGMINVIIVILIVMFIIITIIR